MENEKKVLTNIEYFDKDAGKMGSFHDESDMALFVGVNMTENGSEASCAVLGSGNTNHMLMHTARLIKDLVLGLDDPKRQVTAIGRFIEELSRGLKEKDPVLALALVIPAVADAENEDCEKEEGDEK